jgi:hypothetical protein
MKTVSDLLREADPIRQEPSLREADRDRLRRAIRAGESRAAGRASRWAPGPVSFVLAVALILFGALAIGSRLWSPGGATLQAAVRFEARLAENGPGAGLREVQLSGSRDPIYLHQEVIVSNEDVAQSRVVAGNDPARFNIALQFTTAGAGKMRQATADHVGRPIAILIDGEVVMAPRLTGPIGESALVTGDFTRSQAERIANGIGLR